MGHFTSSMHSMKKILLLLVVFLFLTACSLSDILSEFESTDPTTIVIVVPEGTQIPSETALIPSENVEEDALLYSDDFSDDQSGWEIPDDNESSYAYSDGEYVIFVAPNEYYYMVSSEEAFSDAVLTIDLRQLSGNDSTTGGMVIWRALNDYNYYALQVGNDGRFSVHRFLDGEYGLISLPAYSPNLYTNGQSNQIMIVFHGSENEIYFNGRLAYQFSDPSILSGAVGMGAMPDVASSVEVAFDNLAVFAYDPANDLIPQAAGNLPETSGTRQITWQELVDFLAEDHTNWHTYDLEDYNCMDYAIDLTANARLENIEVRIVTVDFVGQELGHAFVAFETKDKGTVFVEPQGDNTYSNVNIGYDLCDDWGQFECMGTIENIQYFNDCDHEQNCTVELP